MALLQASHFSEDDCELLVGHGQEGCFLGALGAASAEELRGLVPGVMAPALLPRRSETILVCLSGDAARRLKVRGGGWHEAEVVSFGQGPRAHTEAEVRWAEQEEPERTAWVDLASTLWCPSLRLEDCDSAPPEGGCPVGHGGSPAASSAAGQSRLAKRRLNGKQAVQTGARGEEGGAAGSSAWLRAAVRGCYEHGASSSAALRRWWAEARLGLVRVSLTPPLVAEELRGLHEARLFVLSRAEDAQFWEAANAFLEAPGGEADDWTALARAPLSVLRALHQAKGLGARYVSPFGVFVAPSQVVPGGLGVFSLLLFHPCEYIGAWEGEWLWSVPVAGRHGEFYQRHDGDRPRAISGYTNSKAIRKYGMRFHNDDTIDGRRTTVSAIIDACRGKTTLSLEQVRRHNEPFGFVNEPSLGQAANCEAESLINKLEDRQSGNRYALMVVTMVPLLPGQEVLVHYGRHYERDYRVGKGCPRLFRGLPIHSPARGEFEVGGAGAAERPASGPVERRGPAEDGFADPADVSEVSTRAPSTSPDPGAPFDQRTSRPSASRHLQRAQRPPRDPSLAPRVKRRRSGLGVVAPPARRPSEECTAHEADVAAPGADCAEAGARGEAVCAAWRGRYREVSPGQHVYVHLQRSDQDANAVPVPYSGWFEAEVLAVSADGREGQLCAVSDDVNEGYSMGVDFGVARWLPRASAASVGKDLERDPGAWLRLAARSVRPGREDGSAAVFFARWWLEVRWGLARVSSTPPPVLRDLRELQEARRFVASAGWSEELSWAALAWPVEKLAQADGLALAGCPQGLAQAAAAARRRGATRFFPHGLFAAPCVHRPGGEALYSLLLLHPGDAIPAPDEALGLQAKDAVWLDRRGRSERRGSELRERDARAGVRSPLSYLAIASSKADEDAPNCEVVCGSGQMSLVVSLPVLPLQELVACSAHIQAPKAFSHLALRLVGAD